MISQQSIMRYIHVGLLVCYAGFAYSFDEGTLGDWRKIEQKRLFCVEPSVKPVQKVQSAKQCNEKKEQLLSQKENLNRDVEPYEKRVKALKQRGEVDENLPPHIYLKKDFRTLELFRESTENIMKRECSSWWPWNKCLIYKKQLEDHDNKLNEYKVYDSKYKELDSVNFEIENLKRKKKAH